MRQAAAGLIRGSRIDRGIADLHIRDLPVHIDHVRNAIRHPVGAQNAIRLCGRAVPEIAQKRECQFELIGENFLGRGVIFTDAKYFCIFTFELCDTSLVRGEFLRSATGESGWKERQYDRVLAFEIGQRDFTAHGGAERKVWGRVPHLKRCGIAGLLGEHNRT